MIGNVEQLSKRLLCGCLLALVCEPLLAAAARPSVDRPPHPLAGDSARPGGENNRAVAKPAPAKYSLENPSPETRAKLASLIEDDTVVEVRLKVDPARPRMFRTTYPMHRISVADPRVINVVQYGPKEFEIIGEGPGTTTLTIFFEDDAVSEVFRAKVSVGRTR